MTRADNRMNPIHYGSDLINVQIRGQILSLAEFALSECFCCNFWITVHVSKCVRMNVREQYSFFLKIVTEQLHTPVVMFYRSRNTAKIHKTWNDHVSSIDAVIFAVSVISSDPAVPDKQDPAAVTSDVGSSVSI